MFWLYFGFVALILALLAVDLGVLNRRAHVVGMREALSWSALWISLGLLFCVAIYFGYEHHWMGLGSLPDHADGTINDGARAAIKYLTAYLIEESLSVDNLFVIAMVFTSFGVPARLQHRVLYWGILGALVMRGTMIGAGAALIARFHWILYLFGAFLIYTAYGMLRFDVHAPEPGHNAVVRLARRLFPVTRHFHAEHFFVRAGSPASRMSVDSEGKSTPDPAVENAKPGTLMITPLALALVMVETCDVVFAIDSVPAIFSITADPFLVFTSNVFAILGLRSLFFALAGMLDRFHYLEESLAVVLAMIGVKMLAGKHIEALLGEDYNFWVLAAVLVILLGGVVASLVLGERPAGSGAGNRNRK